MIFLLYKLWFHPIHRRILVPHDNLAEDEFQTNQGQIPIDLNSHLSQSSRLRTSLSKSKSANNGRLRENRRWNLQTKINQNVRKRQRTKDGTRISIDSETIDYSDQPLSSPPLAMT
ncbi:unnamed protein product [Adineta steineri]|nr:unnamed protein product [Adineta steineri]